MKLICLMLKSALLVFLIIPSYLLAQNVGVGITNPQNKLHVVSNTTDQFALKVEQGSSGDGISVFVNTNLNSRVIFEATSAVPDAGLTVFGDGKVGINQPFPGYALDVVGTGNFNGVNVGLYGNGQIGVRGSAIGAGASNRTGLSSLAQNSSNINYGAKTEGVGGAIAYGIFATASGGVANWAGHFVGDVHATGVYTFSDRKLKSDIKPMSGALSIINQLKPSVYSFRTKEYEHMHLPVGVHYGLIADELAQILPVAVKKAVQPEVYENNDEINGKVIIDKVEFNAVNYTELVPVLIAAMKEQNLIIEDLKKRIVVLEKLIQ